LSGTEDIRDLQAADLDWVHPLNQANGEMLSFMERPAFAAMAARAAYARIVAPEAGFLLAFDRQPIPGDSPNFDWFQGRFSRYLYIDRIAVAPHARRQGVAQRLYADVAPFARANGYAALTAEINSDPPNPGSDDFHAAQGFSPIGSALVPSREYKTVTYVALSL